MDMADKQNEYRVSYTSKKQGSLSKNNGTMDVKAETESDARNAVVGIFLQRGFEAIVGAIKRIKR